VVLGLETFHSGHGILTDGPQVNKKVGAKLASGIETAQSAAAAAKKTACECIASIHPSKGSSGRIGKLDAAAPSLQPCHSSLPFFLCLPCSTFPLTLAAEHTPSSSELKSDATKTAESARQNVNQGLGSAAGKARDAKDELSRKV
jgi:hypothetical protein